MDSLVRFWRPSKETFQGDPPRPSLKGRVMFTFYLLYLLYQLYLIYPLYLLYLLPQRVCLKAMDSMRFRRS